MKVFKFLFLLFVLLIGFWSCLFSDSQKQDTKRSRVIPYSSIWMIISKNSSQITASPFGIQAGTLEDSLVAKAANIGVKWTRLGASWPSIEKEKGIYSWEETDKAFEVALKNGMTLFITIGVGNEMYSKVTTYDDPKFAEIYGYRPEPPIKDVILADYPFMIVERETIHIQQV